jgi:hypothetical protein
MTSRTRYATAAKTGAALAIFVLASTSLAMCSGDPSARTTTVKALTEKSPATGSPAITPRKHPKKLYWGAQIGSQLTGKEAPWSMKPVRKLQRKVGKGLSIISFASPFADCAGGSCTLIKFPTTPLDNVRNYGAIPLFNWSSSSSPIGTSQPDYQLSDLINGKYDAFIREFANSAALWGHPFFLRFDWEMNGNWYPWSERRNGNKRGQYVTAWRHVHDIFTSAGATNVSWIWCPNVEIQRKSEHKYQGLPGLYPGDAYVDWTCLDGFNWGKHPTNPSPWRSFRRIFAKSYHKVRRLAPSKPMVLGEIASSSFGGNKAAWIRDTLATLRSRYGKIRGFVWFDVVDRNIDWPIESSRSSTRAFRHGIAKRAYKANVFGDLSARPIQPPH